jgi:site-specific DNA-cytosine methylase
MEAASVAWHPLGWTPVGFSEIEPFPCAILKHRFPNVPNYGSLTEYQSWPLEQGAIDLLVGGTPCQSFSVAGLRKGLADPRGNLALTFLGLADKLKPKWIVWENVPGVLSSNGGRDFGSFVGALGQLGYGWAMRILDAQHFGVPQRRRRVFVVACLGDWRAAAEVLSLGEGLRGYLETGNKKRKGPAADVGASVEASGLPIWRAGDQANAEHMIDHAGTVNCNKGSHGGFIAQPVSHWEGGDVHPTLNQSAKGSGGVGSSNQELFSQGGAYLVPGQPTPFRKSKRACSTTDNETGVLANSSNTLNNFDLGDTRTTHAVVQPVAYIMDSFTSNSMKSDNPNSGCREVDMTKCLDTSCLNPACHQGGVMITQPVIPIHDQATRHAGKRGENQDGKGNGLGIGQPGDPMNTLTQGDKHAVAYQQTPIQSTSIENTILENSRRDAIRIYEGTCPTLQSFIGTGGCNVPMVQHQMPGSVAPTIGASGPPYSRTGNERVEAEALAVTTHPTVTTCTGIRQGCSIEAMSSLSAMSKAGAFPTMAVRRLTPVECERLQGFPDNWSRISWKGKPEEQCPDGPRYKACGNSMAVPVMAFIGKRIAEVEAKGHQS